MTVYFAVSLYLSYLRALEFTTSNWDLGIFQQALWTTGRGFVLYESGDWETWRTISFLQVHPAPILFLLVPVYTVAPSFVTLFVVQSGAVAATAYPLFRLGTRVLGSERRGVLVAIGFLAYAPVLTANLYDFHLEAFIPFELALFFLLWSSGRYWAGLAVAGAAFTTLEVTPFLLSAVALYFLIAPVRWAPDGGPGSWGRAVGRTVGQFVRQAVGPSGRWQLALIGLAVAAYVALRAFEWTILPALVGAPPLGSATTLGVGDIATPSTIGLTFDFGFGLATKLGYWFLLVALLGFLPLLAPRLLVLSAPWFFFTVQSDRLAWTLLGFQYGFIAAVPLVIAATYGGERLLHRWIPWARAQWIARSRPIRVPAPLARYAVRAGRARLSTIGVGLLVLVIVVNLTFTPINPGRQNLQSALSGFRVAYHAPPGYDAVAALAAQIPGDGQVLASDDLFPLVANDPTAYSLLWTTDLPTFLPYDAAHLPTYVFLAGNQEGAVPDWLWHALSNLTVYGLVGVVWNTPASSVYLWELGYTGPTTSVP